MVRLLAIASFQISVRECLKIYNHKAIVEFSNTYYVNNVKVKKPNTHISFLLKGTNYKNM